jgi:hypothetical protein
MLRGHIAHQCGGRRRVLSIINAEAAQRYGPRVRPSPLAYVTGHKPRDSSRFLPERGAQGRVWTRVSTGPLLKPGSSPSRDLARRDLGPTRGTQHAFLGAPDSYAQGSSVLLCASGPNDASWDVLPSLATWCL